MYGQYPYQNPTYMANNYQNNYTFQRQNSNPQMQYPNQVQAQPQMQQPIPQIQEVRYGTEEEAKAFIVYPNASAYFIDHSKGKLYIKSSNSAGMPSLEYFSLTPINSDGTPIKQQEPQPQIDMGEYIKKSELEKLGFITRPQLQEILNSLTNQQNKSMGVKSNGSTINNQKQ